MCGYSVIDPCSIFPLQYLLYLTRPLGISGIAKIDVNNIMHYAYKNKKLSYRTQIAHQLSTQYVEGIYSNSVTLNSG